VSWQRIRGHDNLIQAFQRAVQRGRLAHAYLFVGPPGVGKRLFAVELARALLCENPPSGGLEACDHCPACLLVTAGTHPELVQAGLPEGAHEWPVDLMREVVKSFFLKSARGRGKIAILDDADDFNEESANCFLKTLEEPPPGSLLLLIGTSADLQLRTVVSRCQAVRFAPLPEPLVAELLLTQGIEDPNLVSRLAHLSGGSPGQARLLADPALWAFRGILVRGLTEAQVDSVGLAKAWKEFVEEAGKESSAQRQRAALVLRLIIDFLHDSLRLKLGEMPRFADSQEIRALEVLGKRVDVEALLNLLERSLQANEQIDRRVQLVLVLEALMDALGRVQ